MNKVGFCVSKIVHFQNHNFSQTVDNMPTLIYISFQYLLAIESILKISRFNCFITFSARTKQENGLPSPKKILYPISAIRLGWESGWQVGSGMQNVGNTCYLNSTLQALFHVPAFANWLVSETHHAEKCSQNGM